MADLDELSQYVEENPDDNDQRWRLAKKLYGACEYRRALEHLQVLRNEWEDRINVLRYLAAAYYRLGRYEEAIRELRRGTKTWPQESGLHEQLARVLEVAGQRLDAADAWEEVLKLDPKHSVADSAIKRLRERPEKTPTHDLNLVGSDSGIHLSLGRACPNCGAQNTPLAELCWQCQAPIFSVKTPRTLGRERNQRGSLADAQTVRTVAGIVAMILLLAAVVLSVMPFLGGSGNVQEPLKEFYLYGLALPRLLTGLVLLLTWPLIVHLGLYLLNDNTVSFGGGTLAGIFPSTLFVMIIAGSASRIGPACAVAAW